MNQQSPMRLTRRGRIVQYVAVSLFLVAVAVVSSLQYADARPLPLPPGPSPSPSTPTATPEPAGWTCPDRTARILYRAGFRGKAHRFAWAIVMRESRGQETTVSSSDDWGLFQWNRPTYGNRSWWRQDRMLDGTYNARIAYRVSRQGRSWTPWGLDANGNLDPTQYGKWSPERQHAWILAPFRHFYAEYPCRSTP